MPRPPRPPCRSPPQKCDTEQEPFTAVRVGVQSRAVRRYKDNDLVLLSLLPSARDAAAAADDDADDPAAGAHALALVEQAEGTQMLRLRLHLAPGAALSAGRSGGGGGEALSAAPGARCSRSRSICVPSACSTSASACAPAAGSPKSAPSAAAAAAAAASLAEGRSVRRTRSLSL